MIVVVGPWRWLAARRPRWTTWRNHASHRRIGARGVVPPAGRRGGAVRYLPVSTDTGALAMRPPFRVAGRFPGMERPVRFEHHRWLGDKRTQLVYDLDACTDADVIDELMAAETYLCFGPDTLAEARNRGLPARAGPSRSRRRASSAAPPWSTASRRAGTSSPRTWPARRCGPTSTASPPSCSPTATRAT